MIALTTALRRVLFCKWSKRFCKNDILISVIIAEPLQQIKKADVETRTLFISRTILDSLEKVSYDASKIFVPLRGNDKKHDGSLPQTVVCIVLLSLSVSHH